MDYYAILEVSKTATQEEIKSAYRKKAMQYHPDRNPGDKDAETMFKRVQEAYDFLSDTSKRSGYDNNTTYSYSYKRPSPPPNNKKKPASKPTKKVHSGHGYSIHDAPPPQFDLWGRPLSKEEQEEWVYNNRGGKPPKKSFREWKDSMADKYESGGSPDLR